MTDVLIRFSSDTSAASSGIGGFQSSFASSMSLIGTSVLQIGNQLTAMANKVTQSFGDTISTFASYDQSMANVRSITQGSSEDFDRMDELAVQLASTMPTTSRAIADGFFQLASSGLDANEIMAVTPDIMNLAAAAGSDFETAANATTAAIATFGLGMDDANRVAEIFQNTNKGFKTTMPELADSLKFAGATAATMGLSFEETAAAIGLARNAGLDASSAGTGLRTVLLALAAPTDAAAESMQNIGFEVRKNSEGVVDLEATFGDLAVAREGVQDPTERAAVLQEIFGKRGIAVAATLARQSDGFNTLAESLTEAGAVAAAVAEQNKGLENQMAILNGAIEEQQKALGEKLAPAQLKTLEFQEKMLGLLNKLPDGFVQWGGGALFVAANLAKMVLPLITTVAQVGLLIIALTGRTTATAAATTATTADTAATTGYTIAQTAANIAAFAFPALLIVAGILAIIIVVLAVIKNWETLVGWFNTAKDAILENKNALLILLAVFTPFIGIPLLIIANWSTIIDFFKSMFTELNATATEFFTGFIEFWTVTVPGAVTGALAGLPDLVKAGFAALASIAFSAGGDLIGNLTAGVLDSVGQVGEAFAGVGSSILSGLGFASPANPTMQGHGLGMMEELVVGLKAGSEAPRNALQGVIAGGPPGVPVGGGGGSRTVTFNFGGITLGQGATADMATDISAAIEDDLIRRGAFDLVGS